MAARLATLLTLSLPLALAACGAESSGGGSAAGDPISSNSPSVSSERASSGAQGDGVLDHTLTRLDGKPDDLSRYRGKVVMVVNTATECGFTPQFEGLERLYEQRRDQGFVILGFPADDVAHQEPRSDEEIAEFCEDNYGVSFPMFAKSNVKEDPVNPVFEDLVAALGEPTWNFNKYLLDREGRPVEHFEVSTEPGDPELTSAIDRLLAD
jgi:glutathione peroxidase